MRSLAFFLIVLGLLTVPQSFVQPALAALDFPTLTGRVVDSANLLTSNQENRIAKRLEQFEADTSNQVVVVTLPSLQGVSIEEFGYQLGRHWGIGQAGQDNGLILIVAPNERKVRIEVGYGLEGDLPDATAKIIIEQYILPAFRNDDFPYGIAIGVDSILDSIDGTLRPQAIGPGLRRQDSSGPPSSTGPSKTEGPYDLLIFFLLIFALMLVLYFKGTMGFGRDRTGWGSSGYDGHSGDGGSGGGFSGGGGSFGGGGSSGSW